MSRTGTMLAGAVGALLLLAPAAFAAERGSQAETLRELGQSFLDGIRPEPKLRIPGPREQGMQVRPIQPAPIQLAQAGDPRIVQLEDQIRRLNGTVEELNFLVLQMQEQLRKMQEDNEFRFQQLEGSGDGVMEQRGDALGTPLPGDGTRLGSNERGEPPRALGQITFDAQGNPTVTPPPGQAAGQTEVQQGALPGVGTGPATPNTDDTRVAALPSTDSPDELYSNSYEFMLSGDYATAEAGFRQHSERYPDDPRAADTQFWLGEALLAQGQNREAAQTFLSASRTFPDARKAPDMMLKLGVALAGMGQQDVACATLAEVGRRYPDASAQIKGRVQEEQQRASC